MKNILRLVKVRRLYHLHGPVAIEAFWPPHNFSANNLHTSRNNVEYTDQTRSKFKKQKI